jgi:hypothetical protein
MTFPWTLIPRTPWSISLLVGNRVLTATGMFVWWRRIRQTPGALGRFVLWGAVVNLASWACLIGLLRVVR